MPSCKSLRTTAALLALTLLSLAMLPHLRPLVSLLHPSPKPPLRPPATMPVHYNALHHPHSKLAGPAGPAPPHAAELRTAQLAVQRASQLTRRVYRASSAAKGTTSKEDHSPVTVGDYGAQALVIAALRSRFPGDAIIAEEDAADLRANEGLRSRIWENVRALPPQTAEETEALGPGIGTVEEMMDAIDGGRATESRTGRVWTLDPIDGTKGFLRGGQYAIALALIVEGEVAVGVLGCPNLPVDDAVLLDAGIGTGQSGEEEGRGVMVVAARGQGAWSTPFQKDGTLGPRHAVQMRPVKDIAEATFCEGIEAAHSNLGEQGAIAKALGITKPSVKLDSQAKYASLARGAADIYLRLPVNMTYRNKIWDHAAGDLIVEEAGGKTTDVHGDRIDFGAGRLLNNVGFVTSSTDIHAQVLAAVRAVLHEGGKL